MIIVLHKWEILIAGIRAVVPSMDVVWATEPRQVIDTEHPETECIVIEPMLYNNGVLRSVCKIAPTIVLTASDVGDVVRAAVSGAVGYVHISQPVADLRNAIVLAASGSTSMPSDVMAKAVEYTELAMARRIGATSPLATREFDTLVLIGRGLSNKQIAEVLVVDEQTVKTYSNRIYRKLRITSGSKRTQAAIRARDAGITEED